MNIRETLKSNGGYISHDNMKPFIEEFGADFPVVIKQYKGDRLVVKAEDVAKQDQDNIREVFISGTNYDKIFG